MLTMSQTLFVTYIARSTKTDQDVRGWCAVEGPINGPTRVREIQDWINASDADLKDAVILGWQPFDMPQEIWEAPTRGVWNT